MRVKIDLNLQEPIQLPIQYNHILQALILKMLGNEEYQTFLHDEGYGFKKRNYKLYTFSRLQGKFKILKDINKIMFFDRVSLLISSYDEKFFKLVVNNNIHRDSLKILGKDIEINNIEASFFNVKDNELKVYTKSPITVYSTFKIDEKNKTYYYSPYEKEFSEMIRKNLINKYIAFHGKEPEDTDFSIEISKRRKPKESVIVYKGIVIKAWNGEFILKGSTELLNLAYKAGIGSKNSQGFGCLELAK
ncbi:CRISPR-associated endoribonuclease Cas6 [Haloimpatiens sp. FM7330]|uniref:CRISPR-associated endoribonuclease Cas6 n=1 Tax=Haloimpatiens sp. FM7330 TaxID=3298610 RepID=UPI0036449DD3